jgi:hypothetical protein
MNPTDKIIDEGYKPEIYENSQVVHKPTGLAEFLRDMRRLEDLLSQYNFPGLNTFEDNEAKKLREKYNLSHREWYQGEFRRE